MNSTKELIESDKPTKKIISELTTTDSSKIISSKEIPRYWWSNTFHRINKSLPKEELTSQGLKRSLELIGKGTISGGQRGVTYTDENFFGYTLFVGGDLEKEGYRYRVAIRASSGWIAGPTGGNAGGEIQRYGTNVQTISKLIHEFIQEFIL